MSKKRKEIGVFDGKQFIRDATVKNLKEARKKRDSIKKSGKWNARIRKSPKSRRHQGKYDVFKRKK